MWDQLQPSEKLISSTGQLNAFWIWIAEIYWTTLPGSHQTRDPHRLQRMETCHSLKYYCQPPWYCTLKILWWPTDTAIQIKREENFLTTNQTRYCTEESNFLQWTTKRTTGRYILNFTTTEDMRLDKTFMLLIPTSVPYVYWVTVLEGSSTKQA